jgi:hypothetical protein
MIMICLVGPLFSQAKKAADTRSRVLGYIIICQVSCDIGDVVVLACENMN